MASISIAECADSRAGVEGKESPSRTLKYFVLGTEDENVVTALVDQTIPFVYQGRKFQDYSFEPKGGGYWEIEAKYGKFPPREDQKETGESSFQFDTSGGTQHITQSLATISKKARPDETAVDYKGAIGVNGDSIDGVDKTVPVFAFSVTKYLPFGALNGGYVNYLFELTGRTNAAPWTVTVEGVTFDFAAGEALFLGASGGARSSEDTEITFKFAAQKNATGLAVGDITGIAKKGWEYLWVRYIDHDSSDATAKVPQAVYVERVYESGDFSLIGL